jgi:glycerol kinase
MEGSVFVGGAVVQWLRVGLKAIPGSAQAQALTGSAPDADGVMMVPVFTSLPAAGLPRASDNRSAGSPIA